MARTLVFPLLLVLIVMMTALPQHSSASWYKPYRDQRGYFDRPYRDQWDYFDRPYRDQRGYFDRSYRDRWDYFDKPYRGPSRYDNSYRGPFRRFGDSCSRFYGEDCSWYSRCLAVKIPCRGRDDDYAIAYGQKFCQKCNNNYYRLSWDGQRWLDAVRKCLHWKLAPELTRYPRRSCPDLKTYAFDSHVTCYFDPRRAPSFCDLSGWDQHEALDIIRSSLGSDFYARVVKEIANRLDCSKR